MTTGFAHKVVHEFSWGFSHRFFRGSEWRGWVWAVLAAGLVLNWVTTAAAQFDGFTEPLRTIELASDESGLIDQMLVKEGDSVAEGEAIAKLSSDMQQVQLELAEHLAATTSNVVSAEQAFAKRDRIFRQVTELREQGHANENELTRARMELELAQSKLQAARDEHVAREIELRRAQKQMEKRTITAPFAGVIARLHRKEGEFLSPLRPEIVTLVEIDQLYATFNIPSSSLGGLTLGATFSLEVGGRQGVPARLESIGVQTDAESGTVRVKLLIDNRGHELRAGEPCIWNL